MNHLFESSWTIHEAIRLACQLEARAPKAGNVHPGAAFHDMTHEDFSRSAEALHQAFQNIGHRSTGKLILDATQASLGAVGCNTYLGSILLFGPLAKAAQKQQAGL